MSTIINATTTNGVVIQPDNSGSLVLQTNSGTTALTIDTSQNVAFAKGFTVGATAAPAFRAYQATLQSISDNTFTKITLNTEVFDTNSNYDTSNYRFTPTVAGYYFISGTLYFNAAPQFLTVAIYKNGSQDARGPQSGNGLYIYNSTATALIYLNGSTDYVELYGYQNSGIAKNTEPGATLTYFQAFLARSA